MNSKSTLLSLVAALLASGSLATAATAGMVTPLPQLTKPLAYKKPFAQKITPKPAVRPPVLVAPPPVSGPLAGKPSQAIVVPAPSRPLVDRPTIQKPHDSVTVITRPRPPKPVTCIGWPC